MNKKALEILEYEKILKLLEAECTSDGARKLARELRPEASLAKVEEELRSTDEAVDLIVRKGVLPLSGIYQIEDFVGFAKKGGTLTMAQLLKIHYNLSISKACKDYIRSYDGKIDGIRELVSLLADLPALYRRIEECIISEDEMSDRASKKLRDIRREKGKVNQEIKNRLAKMTSSPAYSTILQDKVVTIRNGRYVLPVKANYRASVPGIIHDQSKAGSTLFIEPQPIVNLNNGLRELELAEENEINRILAELSALTGEGAKALVSSEKILEKLDYIMAKGRLSLAMEGDRPRLNGDSILEIREGRHPLIDKTKVVPITIKVGEDYQELIITGPNTGGKTVTLKTAGLLILMAQSGLHIPASPNSNIPILDDIFADIGDEQSIEQSLSTFSSHMTNIVRIVGMVRRNTLTLLDELGAGTDPIEGAALAIAILERIRRRGGILISTTHYTELKKYALSTEGVENGSMEFDVESLSPTYRLILGVAGKSNAFEISKRLGLPEEIIGEAKDLISQNQMEFEKIIGQIEEDKLRAERDRDQARELNRQTEERLKEAEKRLGEIESQREEIIRQAKEEAKNLVEEAQKESKEVREELRRLTKLESLGERNKAFDEARARLKISAEKYGEKTVARANNTPVSADDLRIGDRVKIVKINQTGTVQGLPNSRGELVVQVGALKINTNLSEIMLIVDKDKAKDLQKRRSKAYGKIYRAKTMNVPSTINVQGKNLEDAIMEVEKYLDDAYIAGLKSATIIHGRGEGILSRGIRERLRSYKPVKSFRAGMYNEGGDGVTIVSLKES